MKEPNVTIHIQLQSIRDRLNAAFVEHQQDINTQVQEALARALQPEVIRARVDELITQHIQIILDNSVHNLCDWDSDIRRDIMKLVKHRLEKILDGDLS